MLPPITCRRNPGGDWPTLEKAPKLLYGEKSKREPVQPYCTSTRGGLLQCERFKNYFTVVKKNSLPGDYKSAFAAPGGSTRNGPPQERFLCSVSKLENSFSLINVPRSPPARVEKTVCFLFFFNHFILCIFGSDCLRLLRLQSLGANLWLSPLFFDMVYDHGSFAETLQERKIQKYEHNKL